LFDESPRPLRQAVLGLPPKPRLPGIPLDTAPKGAETHPGDGRLSVGNSSILLFHIYHAWSPQPASPPNLDPENLNPAANPRRLEPTRRTDPLDTPQSATNDSCTCSSNFDTISMSSFVQPRRAARHHKNLSQVLKNMDSFREKSTGWSSHLHFVRDFPGSTSLPIQKATCVDAVRQHIAFPHRSIESSHASEDGILAE